MCEPQTPSLGSGPPNKCLKPPGQPCLSLVLRHSSSLHSDPAVPPTDHCHTTAFTPPLPILPILQDPQPPTGSGCSSPRMAPTHFSDSTVVPALCCLVRTQTLPLTAPACASVSSFVNWDKGPCKTGLLCQWNGLMYVKH